MTVLSAMKIKADCMTGNDMILCVCVLGRMFRMGILGKWCLNKDLEEVKEWALYSLTDKGF